jgi:hypothetical protein
MGTPADTKKHPTPHNGLGGWRLLLVAALACLLGGTMDPSPAPAQRLATVTEEIAFYMTGRYLKDMDPDWVKRDSGSIDCDRGRKSRTKWICKVHLERGRRCSNVRVSVTGLRVRDHVPSFFVKGTWRQC